MTKEKLIKLFESNGYEYLNVIRLGKNGFPDAQFLKDGNTVWVEFKKDKDTLKTLQAYRINWLNNNGFIAFVYRDNIGVEYPKKLDIKFDLNKNLIKINNHE